MPRDIVTMPDRAVICEPKRPATGYGCLRDAPSSFFLSYDYGLSVGTPRGTMHVAASDPPKCGMMTWTMRSLGASRLNWT